MMTLFEMCTHVRICDFSRSLMRKEETELKIVGSDPSADASR